jgi:uncharacterized protein (TIGR03663 family)
VAGAAILRFVQLGARPMHHDESLDAWFSWHIAHGGDYAYDPVYHGPLRFYLVAAAFRLLGEGEATARVLAALCGTGIVGLTGAMRRWLGDVGSLAAAALLALSPSMLYFSRFGREDMLFALLELALLVTVAAWLTRPAAWQPPAFGGLLGAAFATKETSFIVVAVLATYLGGLWLVEVLDRRRGRRPAEGRTMGATLLAPGPRSLALGIGAFALVFVACFSVGFTHLGGVADGVTDGISYWLSQQPVNRGSQPWPFYLTLLAGYEWPVLLLAGVGMAAAIRRIDTVRGLLLWTAVANVIIYSWASERFPWLVVHPLLPLTLLAGLGAERLWQMVPRQGVRVVAAAVVLIVVAALAAPVVYVEPTDPAELLVAVQSSDRLAEVRDRVQAIYDAAPEGSPPRVVVDTGGQASWPWAWYLRDRPVLYADLATDPAAATDADVVLALEANVARLPAPEGGWRVRPYAHRVWWLPSWDDATPTDWVRWVATRQPFGPMGQLDAVELERPTIPE